MKQTIIALAAAGLLAAALPSSAQARCHGCGIAAGAAAGLPPAPSSARRSPARAMPSRRPSTSNRPRPRFTTTMPMGPVCHVERHRVWVEGYGWRHRRVEVCD